MMAQEPDLNEILKRLESVERKLGIYDIPNPGAVLEELILNVDSRTLQLFFREVNAKQLALAIVGLKLEALRKLKIGLSKNAWEMLQDEVAYLFKQGSLYVRTVKDAQTVILAMANQMRKMGKIVVLVENGFFDWDDLNRKMTVSEEKHSEKMEDAEVWKKNVFDSVEKV